MYEYERLNDLEMSKKRDHNCHKAGIIYED